MTASAHDEREAAVAAADGTCPRCGSPRDPDQRYCLECGLVLPQVHGRVPALRRRWIRRFGWYPGDWVWLSLLTLVVAVAGTAVSIAVTHSRSHAAKVQTAPPVLPTTQPAVSVPTTTTAPPTTTSPKPKPKPHRAATPNGRLAWPEHVNGWTIVLFSYPKTVGVAQAQATALRAAQHGLGKVGVLDSSRYASLQPGYYVVFTGIYGSKADADASVATARQAGFAGAYSRQVAG
jgi:cell division septation protein DedD